MSGLIINLTLLLATLTSGLMAGLYFAFTCAVMPGLRKVDDRVFIATVQRINVAILNFWFGLCFLGALVFTGLAVVLLIGTHWGVQVPVVIALALYVVTLGLTFGLHIPLNNALNAAGPPERITDPATIRQRFEGTWTTWNLVRTVAATAAFALLCWALVLHGQTIPR